MNEAIEMAGIDKPVLRRAGKPLKRFADFVGVGTRLKPGVNGKTDFRPMRLRAFASLR
jgi:hypothetical protein